MVWGGQVVDVKQKVVAGKCKDPNLHNTTREAILPIIKYQGLNWFACKIESSAYPGGGKTKPRRDKFAPPLERNTEYNPSFVTIHQNVSSCIAQKQSNIPS